jgi:hypothetical protein
MNLKTAISELEEAIKRDDELDNPQQVWDWESLESHCQDLVNKAQALLTQLKSAEVGETHSFIARFNSQPDEIQFCFENTPELAFKFASQKGIVYFSPIT